MHLLAGSFQTGDVRVFSGVELSPTQMRDWIRGEIPIPGSDYRAYLTENVPDDEWYARLRKDPKLGGAIIERYEQAEEVLAAGASRFPGSERELTAEEEDEAAEERQRRKTQLDAATRAKQPRKRPKASDGERLGRHPQGEGRR